MGPTTDPCGTPEVTGHGDDRSPSTITACVRLRKKSSTQVTIWTSFLGSTLSKALLKSMNQAAASSPLSIRDDNVNLVRSADFHNFCSF